MPVFIYFPTVSANLTENWKCHICRVLLQELTGSVTVRVTVPPAAARAPGQARDLVYLPKTVLAILIVEFPAFLRSDQRLHGKRVRLQAHGARRPPLIGHA